MSDFLTVEDINSVLIEHKNSFWDSIVIGLDNDYDFDGLKFNYLSVDREYINSSYTFKIQVDNKWSGACYFLNGDDEYITDVSYEDNIITVVSDTNIIKGYFEIYNWRGFRCVGWVISNVEPNPSNYEFDNFIVTLESVNPDFELNGKTFSYRLSRAFAPWKPILISNNQAVIPFDPQGFTLKYDDDYFDVVKHSFMMKGIVVPDFTELVCGKINDISFSTNSSISYNGVSSPYPISYGDSFNHWNLDLRSVNEEINIPIKVGASSSNFSFEEYKFNIPAKIPTITTLTDLTEIIENGGVCRLGANISLSEDLTTGGDAVIIGEEHTLSFENYKITVNSNNSLKISDTTLTTGTDAILQEVGSIVEINNCNIQEFVTENGVGGFIKCNVNLGSFDNPTDFETIIRNSNFTSCECPILSGGKLIIENCNIQGELGSENYPYFLYQTDGNATITGTEFNITKSNVLPYDIKFNSCIFTAGKEAKINGLDYLDLKKDNLTEFLENNHSSIDLTYQTTGGKIHISGENGFCHSVSGLSKIFKTKANATRED